MNESNSRITQRDNPPSAAEIEQWIGREASEYWKKVTELIELRYPEVFEPEWLFGGQKHGWLEKANILGGDFLTGCCPNEK